MREFLSLRVKQLLWETVHETKGNYTVTNADKKTCSERAGFVRKRRFELPHQLRRYHLKVVRLPISPPPHVWECKCIVFIEMLGSWPVEIFMPAAFLT